MTVPVAPIWETMGKRRGQGVSLGDTNLSGAEETPTKATEEGVESFKQEGRGASKRLKRRGRRTRKKASEGGGAGGAWGSTC